MRLGWYIGKRLLSLIPQLLAISFVTFLLIRLLPGNPAYRLLGPLAGLPPRSRCMARGRRLRLTCGLWAGFAASRPVGRHGDAPGLGGCGSP